MGGRDREVRNEEHARKQCSSHLRAEQNNGEKSNTSVTLKAEVSAAELQDLIASASHQQSPKSTHVK